MTQDRTPLKEKTHAGKFFNLVSLSKFSNLLIILLAGISLAACSDNPIYDDEQDCDAVYKVRFIYEYNMSGGDGFPSQVSSISLWVFDHSTGNLVKRYSDSGTPLSEEGYLLELDGLQPGLYDFIAWGGLEGSQSFTIPANISRETDLTCSMVYKTADSGEAYSNTLLNPLFYGALVNLNVEDVRGEKVFTVYLMKDTNNINLSLQHMSEDVLDFNDFTIYMDDANANLDYDNDLLPSPVIRYYPWSQQSGNLDMSGSDLNYLQAEISTCRLMENHNPSINIVDNATGVTVYSIPIVEWANKLRLQQNMSMTDQEYLDREHEYTIMVHLVDDNGG